MLKKLDIMHLKQRGNHAQRLPVLGQPASKMSPSRPSLELAKSRAVLAEVTSMPPDGLIGDSSLYVKSGKNVRRVGSQLQEQLGTTDLWYHSVANAAVHKILQMPKDP